MSPHTIQRTDSVWIRNQLNCPKTQAVSGNTENPQALRTLCQHGHCAHASWQKPSRRTGWLMRSRSTGKFPSVTSDSTYSYIFPRCFCGLSRSRSPIGHDSYRMSTCTTVDVTQCCSEVNEDKLWRGRWVAAQKPSYSIWQVKPACWGLPESNFGCSGPVTS